MGQRFLMDTSAIAKYLQRAYSAETTLFLDTVLDNNGVISFITQIEPLSYNPPQHTPEIAIYKEVLKKLVAGIEVIGIDDDIIAETIKIRKTIKLKLPDALIAGTAIARNFVLLSDNDSDFEKAIPLGLQYENPKNSTL
jgi:predicted nucleic acid-binding protein